MKVKLIDIAHAIFKQFDVVEAPKIEVSNEESGKVYSKIKI
jgi:hypothetical protein